MSWKDKASLILKNTNLIPMYSLFGGLSEFYCFWLFLAICYFEYKGKLEGSFAAAITAITGILALHDGLDDYFVHRREQRQHDDAHS